MSQFAVRRVVLTRIWHVFLWIFRVADVFSTSEDFFLKDYKTGSLRWKKQHVMILSQGSYRLYPETTAMFEISYNKKTRTRVM